MSHRSWCLDDLNPRIEVIRYSLFNFGLIWQLQEQSHKSYRPLTVLTFRLNYWLHQLEPWGYHATNVFLHALVCLLYLR